MKGITIAKAVSVCKGEYFGDESFLGREISSVTIDSRTCEKDCLFCALKGENSDGHDYIQKALDMGALCCLSEHPPAGNSSVIAVSSVAAAIQALGAYYRSLFNIPVIGITGSVGKTTTKEMLAAVLSQRFNVHKTRGNFNNELGVPLTLFGLDETHEAAVIEMGISQFGEMTRLTDMVRPDIAVITTIGQAHLEVLGSRQGVLKAKSEILKGMSDSGRLFINGDDDVLKTIECRQQVIRYGLGDDCGVRAHNLEVLGVSGTACDVSLGDEDIHIETGAFGSHMVYAALAACAVAHTLGLTGSEIVRGVKNYADVGSRSDVIETGFCRIIDGSYNANPTSTASALQSLAGIKGRCVAILGDMKELGEDSYKLHIQTGSKAAGSSIELLIACGDDARGIYEGAEEMGSKRLYFKTKQALINELPALIQEGDTVLVKASRGMKFEDIADKLKELKPSSFSEKSLFAQGVHVSVRPQQKD